MLDQYDSSELARLDREIVATQLNMLETNESQYRNSFSTWLFALILCVEVGGAVSIAYKHDYQKEHEKLINAISYAAIPIALTVSCCFVVAQKFGIKQEQERLSSKYRSILEQQDI